MFWLERPATCLYWNLSFSYLFDFPVRSTSFACWIFSRSWMATALSKTTQCCLCSVERSFMCRLWTTSMSFCCFLVSFTNCFSDRSSSIVNGSKPRSSVSDSDNPLCCWPHFSYFLYINGWKLNSTVHSSSNYKASDYLTIFRTTSCYRLYTVLYFAF